MSLGVGAALHIQIAVLESTKRNHTFVPLAWVNVKASLLPKFFMSQHFTAVMMRMMVVVMIMFL